MTPKERYGIDPAEMVAIKRDDLLMLQTTIATMNTQHGMAVEEKRRMVELLREAMDNLGAHCIFHGRHGVRCSICGGEDGEHFDDCITYRIRELLRGERE